jgi:hypothetical protein
MVAFELNTKGMFAMLLGCLILSGCRTGYKVENEKVYYLYWNEGSGNGKSYVQEADAATFQKLEFDCSCPFSFGRDKDHLFIDGRLISDINPNSFRFVGNYVFADDKAVYFWGFYNDINDCAIKGIDQSKLQLISYPWAKAGNVLIYGKDTLTLDDIEDFKPIDKNWGLTSKYVIYENQILTASDVATFEVINSYTGKDKKHIYEFGQIKR